MAPNQAMFQMANVISILTESITQIDHEIEVLRIFTEDYNIKAQNFLKSYYEEFSAIKKNLRECRLKLTSLAKKTVHMTKKIRGFFKFSKLLGDNRAVELQLNALRSLLMDSVPILENASKEYKEAISRFENFAPEIVELNQEVEKMLNTDAIDNNKWSTGARSRVYSSVGIGTIMCVVMDFVVSRG